MFVETDGIAGTFLTVISMKKLSRKQVLLSLVAIVLLVENIGCILMLFHFYDNLSLEKKKRKNMSTNTVSVR